MVQAAAVVVGVGFCASSSSSTICDFGVYKMFLFLCLEFLL